MIIEERNNEKKVIFHDLLKKLNFGKTFEDIIENELDFHGYGNVKIENPTTARQLDDINIKPLTCELHETLLGIVDFNPALKVINITLAYENDENNIDFGVAEKKMD